MHPPLPEYPARLYALHLARILERENVVDFDGERKVSTQAFFTEEQGGTMFGVLVARDEMGNEVLLKAFSGACQGERNLQGWADHLVEEEAYQAYLEHHDPEIKRMTEALSKEHTAQLAQQRSIMSQTALQAYYNLYRIPTLGGEPIGLGALFSGGKIPTGSGDCCAIKLLGFALSHRLTPMSMAEFYFGRETQTRKHLQFYGPCDEKCKPILKGMLHLDIIHRDEDLMVVNKPASLLSVPGNGAEHQDSVETRVRLLFPDAPRQCAVHRLDMDTSGLLVIALNKEAYRHVQHQFREHMVQKTYVALLDGVVTEEQGRIELPFRLDPKNRPHQIYDEVHGKWGTTLFHRIRVERRADGRLATRMLFIPLTGRTHQLRLHSAHPKGLGKPIIGDRLYGNGASDRLHLHAKTISFLHPRTNERMEFSTQDPF
ncbi:RluA family pseudouridine synthase [Sphaerochaeta sp.]|uniref:RluA family pseudouridine synthase n=1 Tax=Sphaerochaeta sp. TaxID=1972642 RepID=UPI002FC80758